MQRLVSLKDMKNCIEASKLRQKVDVGELELANREYRTKYINLDDFPIDKDIEIFPLGL